MSSIIKGRGATLNLAGRYAKQTTAAFDDGWLLEEDPPPALHTTHSAELAKTILIANNSPDIPFDYSLNPYQGCEHGCIYCYARPSHAYKDLSPGLDFETKLFYKPNAAALLEQALARPGYTVGSINLGSNTDPYQPLEKDLRITRSLLEVLHRYRHPVGLITKGSLILRDLDLLADMARQQLVAVYISLTTLDPALKRSLEPRAASAEARLKIIRSLSDAGVPVGVNVSPLIPFINDQELEQILAAAQAAGAVRASSIFIRLPHEVAPLFRDWLQQHYPERKARVMHAIQSAHGGKDYRSDYRTRFTGTGPIADMLRQRFTVACKRLGLTIGERIALDSTRFMPPNGQGSLF